MSELAGDYGTPEKALGLVDVLIPKGATKPVGQMLAQALILNARRNPGVPVATVLANCRRLDWLEQVIRSDIESWRRHITLFFPTRQADSFPGSGPFSVMERALAGYPLNETLSAVKFPLPRDGYSPLIPNIGGQVVADFQAIDQLRLAEIDHKRAEPPRYVHESDRWGASLRSFIKSLRGNFERGPESPISGALGQYDRRKQRAKAAQAEPRRSYADYKRELDQWFVTNNKITTDIAHYRDDIRALLYILVGDATHFGPVVKTARDTVLALATRYKAVPAELGWLGSWHPFARLLANDAELARACGEELAQRMASSQHPAAPARPGWENYILALSGIADESPKIADAILDAVFRKHLWRPAFTDEDRRIAEQLGVAAAKCERIAKRLLRGGRSPGDSRLAREALEKALKLKQGKPW